MEEYSKLQMRHVLPGYSDCDIFIGLTNASVKIKRRSQLAGNAQDNSGEEGCTLIGIRTLRKLLDD